ncbi:hypothetical protein [Planococcus sp. ISL-110]|uniref:hypothetical protein n=1 Tax=Planococcus sp. ISL-110 TaxID=2819167 RepID=UPI001BE9B1A9|nr:hypothetical protein [Planococcus sp. ISL-110]MBT2570745.1 hypothetical protein [Planococcus sp. ISL-110]
MTDTSYTNIGDVVATIVILGFAVIIPAIVIFIIYKVVKKSDKKANERLSLECENSEILQNRIDELDDRVVVLEKVLRDGE